MFECLAFLSSYRTAGDLPMYLPITLRIDIVLGY